MTSFKRASLMLMAGTAAAALSGCGASDIASPGEGVIVIPSPTPSAPAPTPSPTPTPGGGTGLVTPAAACPTIPGPNPLADRGTITGPTGTYRNCAFPVRFTASTQIPNAAGTIYSLDGRVDVGTDAGATSTTNTVTLGIDPGVKIFGATGVSFLAVNRGNRINAVGTATQPIIFTGRGNVTGVATDDTSQLWGGVVVLGRAPITDCLAPGAAEGTAACERDTEGTSNALYGGAQPADNSGRMSYVQIRYSGFILSGNSELQGLTPGGVGSGTQFDHIQIHNSSDDGIEIFGGRPNMKYLVMTGTEDDALDTDVGYKGFIQYVLAIQRVSNGVGIGNGSIEADSNGNENANPRQNVTLSNFTFIQRGTSPDTGAAVLLRGGTDYTMINGHINAPASLPCLRFNSATTTQAAGAGPDEQGPPRFFSVLLSGCTTTPFNGSGGVETSQVQAIFTAGTNTNAAFTSTLTNTFINGANETAAVAANPQTVVNSGGFFDAANYVGAVRDANDTWYRNWTCNSATANFGSSSGACTSLPTT